MRPPLNSGMLGGLMIGGVLKRYLASRRRFRQARIVAEKAFAAAYRSRTLIPSMTSAYASDRESLVLQPCDDWGGIPPSRSWWLVSGDGACRELSPDEAGTYKPLPTWR
jgi:hypothetical protein